MTDEQFFISFYFRSCQDMCALYNCVESYNDENKKANKMYIELHWKYNVHGTLYYLFALERRTMEFSNLSIDATNISLSAREQERSIV